jgi:hypothetical protein
LVSPWATPSPFSRDSTGPILLGLSGGFGATSAVIEWRAFIVDVFSKKSEIDGL